MALKTDYKDDILAVGNLRKYQMIDNGDGTVSFQDVTVYEQTGDTFGAGDINNTNQEVNSKLGTEDVVNPTEATEEGFAADAKLTGEALSELNSNLTTRYNPENDYIEILYNGEWHKALRAFIQSLKLIENGYIADGFYGKNYTQNSDHISVSSLGSLIIKVDLTNYTKIVTDFSTTTGNNSSAWEGIFVLNGNNNTTDADTIMRNAILSFAKTGTTSANNYVNKELDVSGLSGEYNIAFTCYGKTLSVTKLQVI